MDKDPRFAETVFCVEATDYEKLLLWEKYHNHRSWVQDSRGLHLTVGSLDNRPVAINCFWNIIDGRRILFWSACSQVVDHLQIEKWFDENCTPIWDGNRQARCDAMNFHHCMRAIDIKNGR